MTSCAKIKAGKIVADDQPGALFPWWSVTKTVLAAAALRLVADNRLSLDAPRPGRPYSLEQLLQHRAGVPNYGDLERYRRAVADRVPPWRPADLMERVGGDRLDFQPGTGWAYSNTGYLLVRQLIEETLDVDIEIALQRLVFDPLELESVHLARKPRDLGATAWGNETAYHPGWVYHGLLIGTAAAAAVFMDRLMGGHLLPADLKARMTTPFPLGGPLPGRPWQTTCYGLGLMIGTLSDAGATIGHSGAGPDSVCAVYHFPDQGGTVAAFAQGTDESTAEEAATAIA